MTKHTRSLLLGLLALALVLTLPSNGPLPIPEGAPESAEPSQSIPSYVEKTVPSPNPTPSPESTPSPDPTHSPDPTLSPEQELQIFIDSLIDAMSPREQVSQLFIITVGARSEHAPGGWILFPENITTVEGTRALTDELLAKSKIAPFIAIDEEGGRVSRLRSAGLPGYQSPPAAARLRDTQTAYEAGKYIGETLHAIGVNLDFAPVADILTNPGNTVIGDRAFGSDPQYVCEMVSAFQRGLHDTGVMSALKHFPGHGGTSGNSHMGAVSIPYDAGRLSEVEYLPFIRGIAEGAQFVMAGHIMVPNADPSGLPATLSPYFLTEILRGELGFEGIIVTDAMNMGAITDMYTSAQGAVMAIVAGADMILVPQDYSEAVEGVLAAVESGLISRARIRLSLGRILRIKIEAGLIVFS